MEDRYLFRGKRIEDKEWVQGNLVNSVYKKNDTCVGTYGSNVGMHQVYSFTICQCTGLRDKNGKLIWENDIVKYRIYQRTEQLYRVIYDYEEGSWSLGCNSEPLYSIGRANSEKCEVVSNVFDNPELLGSAG